MHLSYPVTILEVDNAVRQPVSGKAPGVDCIPAELFKKGGTNSRNAYCDYTLACGKADRFLRNSWMPSLSIYANAKA